MKKVWIKRKWKDKPFDCIQVTKENAEKALTNSNSDRNVEFHIATFWERQKFVRRKWFVWSKKEESLKWIIEILLICITIILSLLGLLKHK